MSEVYQKYINGKQLTTDEIAVLYDAGLLTMGDVDKIESCGYNEKARCDCEH